MLFMASFFLFFLSELANNEAKKKMTNLQLVESQSTRHTLTILIREEKLF